MRRKVTLVALALAACALTAATALAASTKSARASARHTTAARKSAQASGVAGEGGPPGGGPGWGAGPGGQPAVHSESVVLNKAGTEFITVTTDSGTVKSVEASTGTLTITEAARSVTYKTVTVSIPSGAKVTLDGKSSSLASLAEGDRVTVSSSSEGVAVNATDSSFHPEGAPGHGGAPPWGQPSGSA